MALRARGDPMRKSFRQTYFWTRFALGNVAARTFHKSVCRKGVCRRAYAGRGSRPSDDGFHRRLLDDLQALSSYLSNRPSKSYVRSPSTRFANPWNDEGVRSKRTSPNHQWTKLWTHHSLD